MLIILVAHLISYAQNSSVETVQFQSKLVNATLPYNVILPPNYHTSSTTRYPVLYLLHGLTGHYSDWATKTNVADYAAPYRMIVVMPEGKDGWYTDSATVPNDKYESYVLKELIPDVQKRYRTIETRFGRGVAGLSMGGYGALKSGLKSPGTFAFAASMSGALAAPSWTDKDLKDPGAVRDPRPAWPARAARRRAGVDPRAPRLRAAGRPAAARAGGGSDWKALGARQPLRPGAEGLRQTLCDRVRVWIRRCSAGWRPLCCDSVHPR